jgi:valyl-tRNA synthetase
VAVLGYGLARQRAIFYASILLFPYDDMVYAQTADLQNFYPSSILESGCDTLFTWAARTALLGVYLTGTTPFKEIFCHGMVRDSYGQKMGKSLGNGIDPLDVIQGLSLEALHEPLYDGLLDDNQITKAKAGHKKDYPNGIPQCGTDALRFAMCAYSGKGSNRRIFKKKYTPFWGRLLNTHLTGNDFSLDVQRVKGYRNFCNTIFNTTKFALLQLKTSFVPEPNPKVSKIFFI